MIEGDEYEQGEQLTPDLKLVDLVQLGSSPDWIERRGKTVKELAVEYPDVPCFRFGTRVTGTVLVGEDIVGIQSKLFRKTGTYWIDAQVYNLRQAEEFFPDERILLDNLRTQMRTVGVERIVRGRGDAWGYFEEGDLIVNLEARE